MKDVMNPKEDMREPMESEEILSNIMTRTSVRRYLDRAVDEADVQKILHAGMAAPSAVNAQPWHFVVVNDSAYKDRIADYLMYGKFIHGAPLVILVCGDETRFYKGDTPKGGNWVQDCSAASENMLLAAHALGLGGVWCGIYPEEDRIEAMREILGLPGTLVPLNVLAFGYPAAPAEPRQKWDPAKVTYK